jgi:predicted Zn-dependent peptidase
MIPIRPARGAPRVRTRAVAATGGGQITRTEFPGGLRVVTEAMPGVRSASVGVWVPVGSRNELRGVAGASHFLEHVLFKGTAKRSALDIARTMDAIGGECNAFTEKEHTCYYATVLDRDLPVAIDIVTDVVLNALVSVHDVDIERGVILEEIAMRDDDPSDLVHDEFAAALFGDTPLGRPILGTVESVTRLSRREVAGYYGRHYLPGDMVVAVAGNISHQDVVRHVRSAFKPRIDQRNGVTQRRQHGFRSNGRPRPVTVVPDDTEQANLVLGVRGVSRHDDRRFALGVLSAALGGGMSSRLFQGIREERGLAYSVYTFTTGYADTGQFGVYAGCQPAKADEVLSLVLAELDNAAAGGVSAAEVERGKGQMRSGMVLGLEDSCARMTRLGKSELCYGEVLGVDELIARIDVVTSQDVADVAAYVLQRPRCLTVVGPFGPHDFDGAT